MRLMAVVVAFSVLALAGCASQPASAVERQSPLSSGQAAAFGGTDLAYIEVSIAMSEQLDPMIGLVPDHTDNPKVQALGTLVGTSTETHLTQLRSLHDLAQLSPVNPHEGMPMPGMVLPVQVMHARGLEGQDFDRYFLARLQPYLEQVLLLARSEIKSGTHPETRRVAEQIERDAEQASLQLKSV